MRQVIENNPMALKHKGDYGGVPIYTASEDLCLAKKSMTFISLLAEEGIHHGVFDTAEEERGGLVIVKDQNNIFKMLATDNWSGEDRAYEKMCIDVMEELRGKGLYMREDVRFGFDWLLHDVYGVQHFL